MMLRKIFFFVLLTFCVSFSAVGANEYFVSPDGSDQTHDGRSPDNAFATIQRGVDALQTGDTLTIMPGQYRESVEREGLGGPEAETLIRAHLSGSVVLRGDVPAPEFHPAEGYRSVYAAEFDPDGEVQVVNERDTMEIFQARPYIREVEFTPATFHHDADAGMLYISTSDSQKPAAHHYTVSVLSGNGLDLSNPQRVIVEGLAATGFNTTRIDGGGNGIMFHNASDSVVRDCHAWMNGFGILVNSEESGSGRNVIEGCVAWANDSPFANWRKGGISALRHREDVIRDCTAFLNSSTGIYLRSDADSEKTSRLVNNLSWGNRWDIIIKGNPDHVNVTERCVATHQYSRRKNAYFSLFKEGRREPGEAPGTILLSEEEELDPYSEFADPDNHDYRLQSTSRFRGTGPDGTDRGPFPYQENIYFVDPQGDDAADGLSLENAWASLDRATQELGAGDTLYLASGSYGGDLDLRLEGEEDRPVSLRGRGLEPPVIKGELRLSDSAAVEFKRLRFNGGVRVSGSRDVAFKHCVLSGGETALEATGTFGLRVEHSRFSGFSGAAVSLNDTEGAILRGNIYENREEAALRMDGGGAVQYSDYNAYHNPAASWEVGGEVMALEGLEELGRGYGRYSHAFTEETGTGSLPGTNRRMATAGPMGNPLGPYRHETPVEELRLTAEPEVHSVSATTANIEWRSLLPSRVHLAWGDTPEMENTDVIEVDYFGSYSLTDLEPGAEYFFRIKAIEESERTLGQHSATRTSTMETVGGEIESETLTFITAEEDSEPEVYYVAPDGNDGNTGRSREEAWRTVQHAADQAGVGDTVLLADGTYEEQVRIRATGAREAPITFKSIPGEKVVFRGEGLSDAFNVCMKSHLRFDGMYFLSMRFFFSRARDIEVTRVFAGQYDKAYPPDGVLMYGLHSEDLLIKNSVASSGKGGPRFYDCSDVRFENCVFFRNMITQLHFCQKPGASVSLKNNIFTDGLRKKFVAPMINLARYDAFEESNNCFYPREPQEEKNIVVLYSDEAFERCRKAFNMGEVDHPHPEMEEIVRADFSEMQEYLGETDSILANPEFLGAADVPAETEDGEPVYPVDRIMRRGAIPFNEFFATNPELVERGIGLQPEAFEDFHFNTTDGN